MIEILGITSPIFLIVFLGYVLTRRGLFAKTDIRALGTFVVNLALPALAFKAVASTPLSDIFNPGYLFAYGVGSLLTMVAGYASGTVIRRGDRQASTFYAMGFACANSGFVGFPILLLTFHSVAGVSLALNMMIENLLVIPLLLIMAERGKHGTGGWDTLRKLARKLATTPLIVAMIGGVAAASLSLSLPPMLARSVDMLAAASSALSLFVIGGALVGLPIGGMGKSITPIVLGKLVLHPLAVALCLLLAPQLGLPAIDRELCMAAILMAAMPMMSIYVPLAMQYGQEEFAAVAQLLTTITAFFTLSGLLWLLRHLPF